MNYFYTVCKLSHLTCIPVEQCLEKGLHRSSQAPMSQLQSIFLLLLPHSLLHCYYMKIKIFWSVAVAPAFAEAGDFSDPDAASLLCNELWIEEKKNIKIITNLDHLSGLENKNNIKHREDLQRSAHLEL